MRITVSSRISLMVLLGLLGLGHGLCLSAEEPPEIDWQGPYAGWHFQGLNEHDTDARVAYPTPPIDRGAQRGRSLILGQLKGLERLRQPHVLAVNGNPLPLYTDTDGRFARPYAFGPGSNSIVLKTSDGKTRKRLQFYEANSGKTRAAIRIVLGWDDPKAEVDLHVLTPDGQHAFFAHPVLTNGGGLDVDSVDGAGPEMFSMTYPMHGTYLVYVNYWGNYNEAGGYNFDENSNDNDVVTTQVTLVFHENTIDERRETFVVPLRSIGDLQFIKAFRY